MNLVEARTRLFRKHYFWARDFLLAEVRGGFPNLRRVQNGPASDYLKFITRFSPAEQERYGLAIQKCSYRGLLEGTSEGISGSDEHCIADYGEFAASARTLARVCNYQGLQARARIDRKMLRKSLKRELGKIPDLELEDLGGGGWIYSKRVGDLLVSTSVGTGSTMYPLTYDHSVRVSARHCIYRHVSILSWMGIAGQTYWEHLRQEDVEPITINLSYLVRLFLDQAGSFIDDTAIELPEA